MFGKYEFKINTQLDINSTSKMIEKWSKENNLTSVKSSDDIKKFRFGSPFISNPIYIEIDLNKKPLTVTGWVQTLIPFLRWKLIRTESHNTASKLDYRRKGGYFCYQLEKIICSR